MAAESVSPDDASLVISTFADREDAVPKHRSTTWRRLGRSLTRHLRLVDKNAAALWSPARYKTKARRAKANVEAVGLLVFDVDDGSDAESIAYWLGDHEYILTSSYSHTPEHPKLRVVVRLVEPIPSSEFDSVWRRANQHLLHGHVDPSTKDESRMYFVPSCPPGAVPLAIVHEGRPLDWRALPPLPKPKPLTKRQARGAQGSDDHKRAAAMLAKWERELAAMSARSGRHNRLLELARAAGGLVASGLLDAADVTDGLYAACITNGLVAEDGDRGVATTIADGLANGQGAAWVPDDLPDSPAWQLRRRFRRSDAGVVDTDTGEILAPLGHLDESDEVGDAPPLAPIPEFPREVLPDPLEQLERAAHVPTALIAGAGLVALAAACGRKPRLHVMPGWTERPIIWAPLVAPRGAGKSPALRHAFAPLRERDASHHRQYEEQRRDYDAGHQPEEAPPSKPPSLLFGDTTLEALARRLAGDACAPLVLDELSSLLRGIGEYKLRGGGDRGRFLALWDGDTWAYTRVGQGGGRRNAVDLLILEPTVSIVGGLQTFLHELLGAEEDGLRPRWLLHLASLPPAAQRARADPLPVAWEQLLGRLLAVRDVERVWWFDDRGFGRFQDWQEHWKTLAERDDHNASVSAALIKADRQLARVCVVLAEADNPAAGGVVPLAVLERAATWVDFTLACWRALPETDVLALSRKDGLLDRAITRLVDWLESHGGRATRRQLLWAHIGGVQTSADLDQLLDRYQAVYPGTVRLEHGRSRGRPSTAIYAPLRRAVAAHTISSDLLASNKSENMYRPVPDVVLSSEDRLTARANSISRLPTNASVPTKSPLAPHQTLALEQLFDEVLEKAGPEVDEQAAQAVVQAFNVALEIGATGDLLVRLDQHLQPEFVARARAILDVESHPQTQKEDEPWPAT